MIKTCEPRLHRTLLAGAALLAIWGAAFGAAAQEPATYSLWEGRGPGSENWAYAERVQRDPAGVIQSVSNVSEPTMTVYLPTPETANGTAVLILPGGGLRGLGWNSSVQQAEWLNGLGVAAIILKYRTLQVPPPDPNAPPPERGARPALPVGLVIRNANANPDPTNAALSEVLHMAVDDADVAMRRIRANATAWRINPDRVGMMGISAGGGVAIGSTLEPQSDASPNFLISLFGPSLQDVNVPAHAPPLFIAVAADHQPVADGLIALHQTWKAAGKSSELHIYDGERQGLGAWGGTAPVERWPDRLRDWMTARDLLPAPQSQP